MAGEYIRDRERFIKSTLEFHNYKKEREIGGERSKNSLDLADER